MKWPANNNQVNSFTGSRRYTRFSMNSGTNGGGTAAFVLGIAMHAAIGLFGGFVLGLALNLVVGALVRGASSDVRALAEFLPFVVSGALLSVFATRRWCNRSAPWVGLLGLAALLIGGQELWFGWSPTWSRQTRIDNLLSQLFGVSGGCGDSECLYMFLFTVPFVCLTAYSITALITLRFVPSFGDK